MNSLVVLQGGFLDELAKIADVSSLVGSASKALGHIPPPLPGAAAGLKSVAGAVTPVSGRAYAAQRALLAGPKKPGFLMKVGKRSAFARELLSLYGLKEAGVPPPLPAAARALSALKKPNPMADALFQGMKNAPKPAPKGFPGSLVKGAAELSSEARDNLPKKDFAVSAKKSNTGKPAYPVEDRAHAQAALGLSAMHGDDVDRAAVRAKVEKKYPDLLKKAAALPPAPGLFSRLGKTIAGERGSHAIDLAGLGTLAALPTDTLQAHMRSKPGEDWQKKSLLGGEKGHAVGDVAGLGMLALPSALKLRGH